MKALTILQPWAWAIAAGLKRVENRTWSTSYRGPLAIHAGKSRAWLKREDAAEWPDRYGVDFPREEDMVFGAIVAIAELLDCVPLDRLPADLARHPWAFGPVCWILGGIRPVEPVNCAGAQGLWTPAQGSLSLLGAG